MTSHYGARELLGHFDIKNEIALYTFGTLNQALAVEKLVAVKETIA